MSNKMNYEKQFFDWEDYELEEKYALISHAIQLGNVVEAKKYRNVLKKNKIKLKSLPTNKTFNLKHDITLLPRKASFTFIDLFAGIGGFRLAMQEVGGKCVFSSEWDESAKDTYFQNYGEVPFGDITKNEIKELIPDYFDVLCARGCGKIGVS